MSYYPEPAPHDAQDLPRYVMDELRRLAEALQNVTAHNIEFLHVAPPKPREGMIRGADGTNWNPGAGKGLYCYYGGAWTKL
jgi:hypothetical protein